MPYADFSLERVEAEFGVTTRPVELFPAAVPAEIPEALAEFLARGRRMMAITSEKARSEILVVPLLLAVRDGVDGPLAVFSGQRLAVDSARGLDGECDYILARTPPLPRLRALRLVVVEAKRGDIELGLGQCAAQMVGARLFNERAGEPGRPVFGCVTTGEDWQFLRLIGDELAFDTRRYYINDAPTILGILHAIIAA